MKSLVYPSSFWPVPKYLKVAGLCFSLTLIGIILYSFDPAIPGGIYPPSPLRELTGLYCPGCGTLRSLHQLLHGNFFAALDLNPLMILFLPYLIYSFLVYCAPVFIQQRLPEIFIKSQWIWSGLVVILIYWVLRNLDFGGKIQPQSPNPNSALPARSAITVK